ncbi:STAS domain-containing protein [Streptomyces sp. 1222.5]|uniref:STAS domain-containing protein n=1 Tax=Streptomyces sp. 1222.5 TaxID=1881026 RepID=UPI003EC008EE
MPSLHVHVSDQSDQVVLTLVGDMDYDTCPRVTQAAAAAAVRLRGRAMCLDLAGVAFMDASGLRLLQGLRELAEAEGGGLLLRGVHGEPLRVLDLTGTSILFGTGAAPGTPAAAAPAARPARLLA